MSAPHICAGCGAPQEIPHVVRCPRCADVNVADAGCCAGWLGPSGEMVACADGHCPVLRTAETHRAHRSVSQLEAYGECGMRYLLQRVRGIPEVPAVWTVGGQAFHSTVEEFERAALEGITFWTPGDARVRFQMHFDGMMLEQENATQVGREEWRVANKGKETVEWWREAGADMAYDYVAHNPPAEREWQTLVMPDGRPVIEYEFSLPLPGVAVPVKGYIDHARRYRNGDIVVVDYKTGSRAPTSTFQLLTYAEALSAELAPFGLRVTWGGYWLARRAELATVDLEERHRPGGLAYQYGTMDRAERAGLYLAQPSPFCGGCGVKAQCPVKGQGDFPALTGE